MLDLVLGDERPAFADRSGAGCFPIVTRRLAGTDQWGIEAAMLAAGTNVEWLRDDLGIIATAEESDTLAASCDDTGDVWYVPALLGLGTPKFDYGARGTLLGLTRGTGRAEVVRAVLEGIAHRGADLVEAAEADAVLRVGQRSTSTVAWPRTRPSCRPWPTRRSASSRSHPSAKPRRSAPPSRPGSPSGSGRATTRSPRRGIRHGTSSHAERSTENSGAPALERAEGWIPELSTIDL